MTNLCDSVTLAHATPGGFSSPHVLAERAKPSHAILSFEGGPRESCCSVGGDELIHVVFGDTIDVESVPVSTEGVNDIVCIAV